MKRFHFRTLLILACCAAAGMHGLLSDSPQWMAGAEAQEDGEKQPTMTIGSPAPALEIENWVQDGNGFFKPVTDFETGKVYVVEFWATWCGPCIASMPHLAALQNEYRGRDVQLISISDEDLETVEKFLERETKNEAGEATTFKEVTSAYCLTSDPDRSVHTDYMKAAGQGGIPTAFIVGKDGLVEWIGHPMKIDEPLAQVVDGTWNRESFKEEFEAETKFQQALQVVGRLASTGKYEQALAEVEKQLEAKGPAAIQERWVMIRQRVKLSAGMIDDELVNYFGDELERAKGKPMEVVRHALSFYQVSREHKGLEPLMKSAVDSLKQEAAAAKGTEGAFLHDTLAKLHQSLGDLKAAVEAQAKAVEFAQGRMKERMQEELEALQKALEAPSETESADDAAEEPAE